MEPFECLSHKIVEALQIYFPIYALDKCVLTYSIQLFFASIDSFSNKRCRELGFEIFPQGLFKHLCSCRKKTSLADYYTAQGHF